MSEHENTADAYPEQIPAINCVICSYNLEGLSQDGLCPECGTPVERSISGDELVSSSPNYVQSLRKGSFLIIAAIVVYLLNFVVSMVLAFTTTLANPSAAQTFGALDVVSTLVNFIAAVMTLIGWWFFSAPDPRLSGVHAGSTARLWVRIAITAQAVLTLISMVLTVWIAATMNNTNTIPLALATAMMLIGLINFVATGVWFFASMLYLRWMAPRIPNAKVYKRAKTLMWLGPLLVTVGALCLMIGPLVALVLYWNMIYWVWKDLKIIEGRQQGLDDLTPAGA